MADIVDKLDEVSNDLRSLGEDKAADTCDDAAAEIEHLHTDRDTALAHAERLAEAMRRLAGNAGAMRAFEYEIREVAGNTNWQCLMDAVADADAALAAYNAWRLA